MSSRYHKFIAPLHFIGDIIILNVVILLWYYISPEIILRYIFIPDNYLLYQYLFANIAWLFCVNLFKAYKIYRVTRISDILDNLFKVILLHFLLIEAYVGVMHVQYMPIHQVILFYIILYAFIVVWRLIVVFSLKTYRKQGYNFRNVVLVGLDTTSDDLISFFEEHPEHGYRMIAAFDSEDNGYNSFSAKFKGKFEDVISYCEQNQVHEIYCALSKVPALVIEELVNYADNHLIRIKFIPNAQGLHYKKLKLDFYDLIPVLNRRALPLDDNYNRLLKRLFDIVFSLSVITLLLSWLVPIIALAIKIDSKGPVFFKQKRSGLDNNDFMCLKFRSMAPNSDIQKQATKNDNRITKVGAFLRKTSLDELPQFFNVLMGDMSIVGPRPHMLWQTEEYGKIIDKYMVRHLVKPGITGLSQAKGFRGETKELYLMKTRVKIDIFYLEHWTFWLDIKIIVMTVFSMLKGEENAY